MPVPHIQDGYTHIRGVAPEVQQEVFFVTDPAPSHSNIQLISMSPVETNVPETIQILEVRNPKETAIDPPQILSLVTDSESSGVYPSSTHELGTRTEKDDNIFVCDSMKSKTLHSNCADVEINQIESPISVPQSTLMDFAPDSVNVTLLNLNEKPTNIIEKTSILESNLEEPHPLDLHELQSEDALAIAVFSPENPSFAPADGIDFQAKDLTKDSPSNRISNIVGSHDLLLMHSSNNHMEEVPDHGFTQDKNLNLCGVVVSETVPGTSAVYGERCGSMLAEASVRAIECTSPSHGQIIEGLMDLDHFLDSG